MPNERKYLQVINIIRDKYSKYIKNSYKPTAKKKKSYSKMGRGTEYRYIPPEYCGFCSRTPQ